MTVAVEVSETVLEFVQVEGAVTIYVQRPKDLVDVSFLCRREALRCQKGEGRLFKDGLRFEVLQVAKSMCRGLIEHVAFLLLLRFLDPVVLQGLCRRQPIVHFRIDQALHELLR